MKSVLDLDELLDAGEITAEEYERFKGYAIEETSVLALNVLLGLGVFTAVAGLLALVPSLEFALVLGVVMTAMGIALRMKRQVAWGGLGSSLLFGGSLVAAIAIFSLADGGALGFFLVAAFLGVAAVLGRSAGMAVTGTLMLSAAVGVLTSHDGDTAGFLFLWQPAATVAVSASLAVAACVLAKRVRPIHETLLKAVAETAEVLAHLGFWAGSLFGDSLGEPRGLLPQHSEAVIKGWVFSLVWAVALLVLGAWGVRAKQRRVVNTVVVGAAVHFFTQYFDLWGFSSASSLIAGVLAIAAAWAFAATVDRGRRLPRSRLVAALDLDT